MPLCCEQSLYASFTSNFSKGPFLAEGTLLETVHGTVNVTGVGGQTQCSRTPPRLLWMWPWNISVNAVRQTSAASEHCLPRADWHFLGTIWDCSGIENIKATHMSLPRGLSSFLYYTMPSSISCSQHTPLPAYKYCRRQLLPSNIVFGQKKNWKSSKHPEALQEGAKCMKMRLCSEWKWPDTEGLFSQYLHTVTKLWYKIIATPNDLKAYFHSPGFSPYVRQHGKCQCWHHSLGSELSYLSLFSIPMRLFLSLHCHPFSSGLHTPTACFDFLMYCNWQSLKMLEEMSSGLCTMVIYDQPRFQTNTDACCTSVSPHVFTV